MKRLNAVSLRENNIAALRDLNSRVLTVAETSASTSQTRMKNH
ncbi:MAG TPA: hypothetical protein VFS76_02005 [Pyrinomonadaceae bacterium]|nr:hypothetical protein [Pyrinomonadaceae bacterium]